MTEEAQRSGRARRAAELALVRVCGHYGGRPDFVLLGGLVPPILCSRAGLVHAGTTDVDVQLNLEIAGGARHAARLERALKNAEFRPEPGRSWRWETVQGGGYRAVIKFEMLADLDDQPRVLTSALKARTTSARSICGERDTPAVTTSPGS